MFVLVTCKPDLELGEKLYVMLKKNKKKLLRSIHLLS